MAFSSLIALCGTANAAAPSLQVNPLLYQDTITTKNAESGHIDVANPSDSPVDIVSSVRGFRQTGQDGQLEFFDDPELAGAIKVDLPSFSLGPREAVRVGFSVNPIALPQGGVYAAIFFRTQPPSQKSSSSFVTESANIGTLLVLQNGGLGAHNGKITALKVPFWQFSGVLSGSLTYRNTDTSKTAVGFDPALHLKITPWGSQKSLKTGLVLPGISRNFTISIRGGYFGLLPITVVDSDTHLSSTAWVFAVTGWWAWAILVLITILIVLALANWSNTVKLVRRIPAYVKKRFRRPAKSQKRKSIDDISPRQ